MFVDEYDISSLNWLQWGNNSLNWSKIYLKKIEDKVHCYWMNSKQTFLIIQSLHKYKKLHISFLSVMFALKEDKDTHKGKASSNQTPALTKSMNMGV